MLLQLFVTLLKQKIVIRPISRLVATLLYKLLQLYVQNHSLSESLSAGYSHVVAIIAKACFVT